MSEIYTLTKQYISISSIPLDLQMFAGEKTEEATDKRKRDAIKEGNIAKSQDAGSAAILLVSFVMLNTFGKTMLEQCAIFMQYTFEYAMVAPLNLEEAMVLITRFILTSIVVILPVLLAIVLAGILINVVQVGFLFRFEPLTPNLDRMNPVSNIQNMFSWKMVAELIKSILKIVIVAYIPYATIKDSMSQFIHYINISPISSFGSMLTICYDMAIKIIMIFVVLAMADWWFQKWRHDEGLKMSKEEIKEEHKQSEGDPHIKQKIREKQRQASQRKQMQEVPKATVVITNPTHIAVAIKYTMGEDTAPKIVAMGAGFIAQKIKEIAKENDVPIVENKPLARAMFKDAEVGQEVPQELWTAVAEILGKIYQSRHNSR